MKLRISISVVNLLLVFLLFMSSCKDDDIPPAVSLEGGEILISNEGNFGWGEGTLSLYNPKDKTVQNKVFKTKNDEAMGNVFQSIAAINNQYYFVINNSGKIVVTDTNFMKTSEITGLNSPRYFYPISDTKAYVTDLYADAISIVDLQTHKVIGSIPCNGHSEEGVLSDGKFWFTAPEASKIYAIDISTDKIVDSTQVGVMPESIVLDNDKRIWVMCRGEGTGKLFALDPTGSLELSHMYELTGVPTRLVYDKLLDNFYYINGDIWTLDKSVSNVPLIWALAEGKTLYSLKIDNNTSEVYVSDVKDFVSRSTIYRYDSDGRLLDEFTAGIIAGDFFFP